MESLPVKEQEPEKDSLLLMELGSGDLFDIIPQLVCKILTEGTLDYDTRVCFPDEGDGDDAGPPTEVSEVTECLLKTSCMLSMSNEVRRRSWSRHKLPRIETTRTPCLNHFMHTPASRRLKSWKGSCPESRCLSWISSPHSL